MSKSRGNAIAPQDVVRSSASKATANYFMTDVIHGEDSAISFDRMEQVYNADLANSWGNLVSRSFNIEREVLRWQDACARRRLGRARERPARRRPRHRGTLRRAHGQARLRGSQGLWSWNRHAANHYIEDTAPWAVAKDEARGEELADIIV